MPGTYRPDATTAGVVAGSALTIVTNHTPVSNTVYSNLDIRNAVMPGPYVSNVTYKNCYFRGGSTAPRSTSSLYAMFRPHGTGFTFIDCTFRPQLPSYLWVGLQGYGFTLRRCDISRVVDQVQVFNPNNGPGGAADNSLRNGPCNVVIEACFFHDSAYFRPGIDTSSNGSHSDDVQWQGGTGLVVRGSYFTGQLAPEYRPNYVGGTTTNSAMMIKPDVGNIANALITKNWFGGGAVSINIADAPTKGRYISNLGKITYNRFYRDQFYAPSAFLVGTSLTSTHRGIVVDTTGNVFDSNNAAVPVLLKFS